MAYRLVLPSFYNALDDDWGQFGHSLTNLEQRMREMDQVFGDMTNSYQRLLPREHSHRHNSSHAHRCDVGFPDALVQNPVVTDKDGNRHLNFRFDVRQFKPEEISIKSFDDNRIEVSAKHETKDDDHYIYREYSRSCRLPEEVDLKTVKSQLNPDGVLCIEAPLPAIEEAPKEKQVQARNEPIPMQIEHQAGETGKGDEGKEK